MLPYRGHFGEPRPATLAPLELPPGPMPSHQRTRALKAWRYVGLYGEDLMLCIGSVRIGRFRQAFWAIWDRGEQALYERTTLQRGCVQMGFGWAKIRDQRMQLNLSLDEVAGIECVCASARSYAWTRKQGGVPARGRVCIDGREKEVQGMAMIDDTAGYYQRHTRWIWSAGVGESLEGAPVAWTLVSGVNDPLQQSERTVWVDGQPYEPPPSRFAPDLSAVDGLRFHSEATRERRENLLLVRSAYRQPFGTFSGTLPNGPALARGFGVMEEHDVRW